jgi:photosystem II stability/assembly factor-like uncharacterized protein
MKRHLGLPLFYMKLALFRHFAPPIRRRVFLALAAAGLLAMGCTGSGAVSPLTPAKASQPDASTAAAEDSDVIYWTSFPVTYTLTDPLNAVCLVNKKFGWACGNNGLILKWDGDTWSKVETGLAPNENFLAVVFADQTEGWVMGTHGIILHYLGGNWSLDNSPTQEFIYGAVVTPSRNVWAVGSSGAILVYNGISWGMVSAVSQSGGSSVTVTDDIYGVGLYGQNSGWACGNRGLILSFDGQKWTPFTASPTTERLNSVSVIDEMQAWIVGAFGTILRFNGTTWTKIANAFSGFDFYNVYMKSDDDGWAVGQDGTIIYYDGSRWISHQKPEGKPSLNAMAFYKDIGFIVGQNGTLLRFQPNGEMAKFTFLFKGSVAKQPTKENPYWTLTYTLMNQSPKASPLSTFELPIPKGLEPVQPKPTATATPFGSVTPGASSSGNLATPTPTYAPATQTKASGTVTPGAKTASVQSAPVTGGWKMKDNNLEWEIGNIASSEMKTITFLLQDKKGEKKEYPVVLQAVLKSTDKVIAEAAPVTMMASEPKPPAPRAVNPTPVPAVFKPTLATPTPGDDSDEGSSPNVQPTPSPHN